MRPTSTPLPHAVEAAPLPAWLQAMTGAVLLSNLFVFGAYAFADPSAVFPGLNEAGAYPARFFAIRHLAFVAPLLHGLVKRDAKVLGVMFHVFLVIAVLDVGSILAFGWPYPFIGPQPLWANALIGLTVFILPMLAGVVALRRAAE